MTSSPGLLIPPPWSEPAADDILHRQSYTGDYMLCPWRAGARTDPRFDDFPSEGRVFGSTVHNHIEKAIGLLLDGIDLKWLAMRQHLRESVAQVEEKDGFTWEKVCPNEAQREAFLDEVLRATRLWYEQVWLKDFDADMLMHIERTLTQPLGTLHGECWMTDEMQPCDIPDHGRGVWLHGTPDVVTSGRIVDWKTTNWPWKLGVTGLHKGSVSPQAPTYCWLWEQETGERIRDFTFYVYDRKAQEWKRYDMVVTDEQIDAVLEQHWQVVRAIDSDVLPCTPVQDDFGKMKRAWYCSAAYCGAWSFCDGRQLIQDGVDLSQASPLTW